MRYRRESKYGTRLILTVSIILITFLFLSGDMQAKEKRAVSVGKMQTPEKMLELYEQDIHYLEEELRQLLQECKEGQG
ncbi:MAG: hypothetical protein ACI4D2_09525 [Lachnospiraceae bacterium]